MSRESLFGQSSEVIRKVNERTDFKNMSGTRRRVVLYLFPFMWVDPHAEVWEGTYEKRRNELSPLGRYGSLWQRFGTRSPVFKISGKMNFENIIRRSLPYFRLFSPTTGMTESAWFDPRVAKFILEYFWKADMPMLMTCDLDMSIVVLDRMKWKQDANEQLAYYYEMELVEVRPIPLTIKGPLSLKAGRGLR